MEPEMTQNQVVDLKNQIVSELSELKDFVHQEIGTLNEKFESLNGKFESLAQDVQQTKTEIIKWVVGIAFGTLIGIMTLAGLYTSVMIAMQ